MARFHATGHVAVTGEGVLDQYSVRAVGGALPPGLVGDRDRPEPAAQLEGEGGAFEELDEPAPAGVVAGLPGRNAHVPLTCLCFGGPETGVEVGQQVGQGLQAD